MAGSTNFLQLNPSSQNQENDAAYLADSQRTGGFNTGDTVPSPLLNKILYQLTTGLAALGAALAAKGYTITDTSLATLTTALACLLTPNDFAGLMTQLAFNVAPAFNTAANGGYSGFQMTLTGNITSSTIAGLTPGQVLRFIFTQDGTGGRTVSWPSSFVGALQPDPAPNAVSVFTFICDNANIPRAPIQNITVATVTGSRALNTVYQNTSGAPMRASVTCINNAGGGGTMTFSIGPTSAPALVVGQQAAEGGSAAHINLTCDIPIGYYYKTTADNPTLNNWVETTYV